MKIVLFTLISCFGPYSFSALIAQDQDSLNSSPWEVSAEANLYFTDPFFILPILTADRDKLHLEVRYNYEDLQTASGWVGYNFSGGNNFQFVITPMVGGLVGRLDGIAVGLELTFDYADFEFYSEMEYVFYLESSADNYFYSWTDLTYSPFDWLWFGISGQRTKVYQTDLEIQRGLILGGSYSRFELTGYFYNPGSNDFYFILALAYNL